MGYRTLEYARDNEKALLRMKEEPNLPEPEDNEVRVRVLYSSASFTDIMILEGKYRELNRKPPFTIGFDMVGSVDAVGREVRQFKPGQMVVDLMVSGACAEYVCVSAERLTQVPDGVNPEEALCSVFSFLTAYQLLHRCTALKPGNRILVHGAGGAVGTALIQLGRLLDLEVYGTASREKLNLTASLGAVPIDYRNNDFVDALSILAPGGLDAVFDPMGGKNLPRSFRTLRRGGKLVSFGFYNSVLGKDGKIFLDFLKLAAWNILPNRRSTVFYSVEAFRKKNPGWYTQDLLHLFELMRSKQIRPVIHDVLPLEKAAGAYDRIRKGEIQGKLLIKLF